MAGDMSKGMGIGIGLVIGIILMAILIPVACTTMCATAVIGTSKVMDAQQRDRPQETLPLHSPEQITTSPARTQMDDELAAEKAYADAKQMEKLKSWGAAIKGHERNSERYPDTDYGQRSARAVKRLRKTHP